MTAAVPLSGPATPADGAAAQLLALVGLRWRMVRSPWVKVGLLLAIALVPLLVAAGVLAARSFPAELRFNAALLTPTAFLGFALLSLVAPLTSGGGNELFPPEQLVAYPVRPGALFAASLAVAPLNLVWVTQLIVLYTLAAFVVPGDGLLWPALVLTTAYVVTVTVVGQALSWLVIGVRATRRGRRATWSLVAAAALVTLVVLRTGHGTDVLDRSPTLKLVGAILAAARGSFASWSVVLLLLTGTTVVALQAGARCVDWALRRPGDAGTHRGGRPVRRRTRDTSALGALVAVDRASVWRSVSLRRGALVLAVLPGLVAAGAGVQWSSLAVLPGLVAAGAGLLFGVNAFCLDASGALWLASLPHRPRLALLSKAIVLAEVTAGAVVVALLAGMLRAPGPPTAAEAVGVALAAGVNVALVVATCLRWSVRRPHRADLLGARDTPAPPATMALYSARLALMTTLVGVVMSGAASGPLWWPPVVVAAPLLTWAALSLHRTARRYDRPAVRARVTTTVATG